MNKFGEVKKLILPQDMKILYSVSLNGYRIEDNEESEKIMNKKIKYSITMFSFALLTLVLSCGGDDTDKEKTEIISTVKIISCPI